MPLKVLLVDDHEVVREGLRRLLEADDDIAVVGEADTAATALRRVGYDNPDVVLLDVRLPDGNGVNACRDIVQRFPDTKILMLSSHADEDAVQQAIVAGASGFLLKQVDSKQIIWAIHQVAEGRNVIDQTLTGMLFSQIRGEGKPDPIFSKLTAPEQRILQLLASGMTNREIAGEVFLAEKTVKNYVSSILAKLGMSNRSEAAAAVARRAAETAVTPEDWTTP